jgi:cytochrome P450
MIFHTRRVAMSWLIQGIAEYKSWQLARRQKSVLLSAKKCSEPAAEPKTPEDFRPLQDGCFQNPFAFYKMLRDQYPVYQLGNGIYCISRYEDIVALSRDTDNYSSTHQGAMMQMRKGQSIADAAVRMEQVAAMGVVPNGVLATNDPPRHTAERKISHGGLNARFVKSLEPEIEALCREMMDPFIERGEVEFMQEFGWRLPMILIIRLLGFPEKDFEQIKTWCVYGISLLSGSATPSELAHAGAQSMPFYRYLWKHYLEAKRNPRDDLSGLFVRAAQDPETEFDDIQAVSAIHQLIIAGSDSSATSMGNALKMLIENPQLERDLRQDSDKLPAFIEEVFRLESAFQGHFRWAKHDCELHGVKLPRGSRVFLMWASGNRDERFWDNPEAIDLHRNNGKKHLTFGHGIHACVGRELARMEIRIVLRELLRRTENLRIVGDAPYIASMFARTLVQLPIAFEPAALASRAA